MTKTHAVATGPAVVPPPTFGPLALPTGGVASVPFDQLTGQALAGHAVTAQLPQEYAIYSGMTFEQLLEVLRQRLAFLEAQGAMTAAEVAETVHLVDHRRSGTPMPLATPPSRPRAAGPAGISVAAMVQRPLRSSTEEFSFFGDLLDTLITAGGAALGTLIGGPVGGTIGGALAHELYQELAA